MKNSKIKEISSHAKQSSLSLLKIKEADRISALKELAKNIMSKKDFILKENAKDINLAKENNLNSALIDRLILNEDRVEAMAKGVEEIANQPQVVGEVVSSHTNEAGLKISRERIPLGVILMIFESRPNVVIDCAALAIKSGNAIILKGGKEAKYSNEVLGNIVRESIKSYMDINAVQVLASDDRSQVQDLLSQKDDIDVVIPRGGEKLIHYVYENAQMPVIAHFLGLCHMYIHEDARPEFIVPLVLNAKTQRTGVCNAIETLILHEKILNDHGSEIIKALLEKNCELRVDDKIMRMLSNENLIPAKDEDWATEYLENILSIKTVSNLDEAIVHIQTYGSNHTECIVSESKEAQDKFRREIDASCIMVNTSTRFNDGGQLGLGAELGISTTKIHAYGPMGAAEMTTLRFVVEGNGQIRQ